MSRHQFKLTYSVLLNSVVTQLSRESMINQRTGNASIILYNHALFCPTVLYVGSVPVNEHRLVRVCHFKDHRCRRYNQTRLMGNTANVFRTRWHGANLFQPIKGFHFLRLHPIKWAVYEDRYLFIGINVKARFSTKPRPQDPLRRFLSYTRW